MRTMIRSRSISFAIFLCTALAACTARPQTTSLKDSIAQQEQKLAQARASNDMRAILTELNILGSLYRTAFSARERLS
jgi:hypothetical protein